MTELAHRRVRRFIFSANRTMWFSACELATFLMTGDTAVKTEGAVKTFSGRGMAMMHECKRLLNDSTASDGLLFPGRRATGGDDGIAHLLVVPRAAAEDADAGPAAEQAALGAAAQHPADAAGSAAEQAPDGAGSADTEPPCKRARLEGDEAADEVSADDQDCQDNACDLLAGGGASAADNRRHD